LPKEAPAGEFTGRLEEEEEKVNGKPYLQR